MDVKMQLGSQHIVLHLEDSSAAQDLVSRLPLTVELEDFGHGAEKIFYTPYLHLPASKSQRLWPDPAWSCECRGRKGAKIRVCSRGYLKLSLSRAICLLRVAVGLWY